MNQAKLQDPVALRGSERMYRNLVEENPYCLLVCAEGRIAYANRALCRLIGCQDPAQFVGRSPLELVHPDDRPHAEARLARVLQTGEPIAAFAERWLRSDGAVLQVEVRAAPVPWEGGHRAVQLLVRDIAEYCRVERSLACAQRHMRELTENVANFAIFAVDLQSQVESWNAGAERVFGFAEADIVGRHFEVLFTPEDRESGAPEWEIQKARTTGLAEDERWHLRQDGSRIFVSGLLIAVHNADGSVAGFTKVARDQTARKLAEDELKLSEARYRQLAGELERLVAERTNHLEQSAQTWESFCYGIAHDLRAPLRTISGFASALLDDYSAHLDQTAQDYAQRMMAAAHRLDEFIADLLEFGRLAHVELPRGPVDLEDVIERVLRELDLNVAASKAQIRVVRPLPTISANSAALEQVIANLLTNALKFVIPGRAPEIEIWTEQQDGKVRLWIRDHGIGISPEHHERVFELFERLHPQSEYPGTGIGLAIVRKTMERMGGRVGLDSFAGNGSTFWVELPEGEPVQTG